MKIYLDNCSYNRPYDDKLQLSVCMEAEAKLLIQDKIKAGAYDLVWSYMNEYENNDNPYDEKRESIKNWENRAKFICEPSDSVRERAQRMLCFSIKPKDALNVSCAIEMGCEYFITTDRGLLKKRHLFSELKIINPIDFVREMEEQNAE